MPQLPLTVETFNELLLTRGTNLSRWPLAEQTAANDLLKTSAEARALLAEHEPVEELLKPDAGNAPDGLLERILDATKK